MTEYTITFKADVTEIIVPPATIKTNDPESIAKWMKHKLGVDDVRVHDVKVFPREVE